MVHLPGPCYNYVQGSMLTWLCLLAFIQHADRPTSMQWPTCSALTAGACLVASYTAAVISLLTRLLTPAVLARQSSTEEAAAQH